MGNIFLSASDFGADLSDRQSPFRESQLYRLTPSPSSWIYVYLHLQSVVPFSSAKQASN